MHDIKYFFLNENNQTIQGDKKNFQREQITKTLPKNTIFQNSGDQLPPTLPGSALILLLSDWLKSYDHFYLR
jgi:hypothetical protein